MEDVQSDLLIFKLIYNYRRLIDHFGATEINILTDIKPTHIPYFMSIGHQGISNCNLLKEIKVTRQGVSKAVKELENKGMIYTAKNEDDARSMMIFLTEDGKKLYEILGKLFGAVTKEYVNLLGKNKYTELLNSLSTIISFHDKPTSRYEQLLEK
ncbi:hypothetical protein ASG22_19930 [Chryseobacterium sp. Leaf405]|uniref:MarR family winged helix-turn-helix transcriptional regulator n=1 Tax=Chryseobacterium sp. Leaf405 TaxID=1736367 RepID=UPI0006FEBF8E|nr:MarR family winged helix-turn-helix transcriptional regulator [Chryseobacterium sp. Leaf405]KQT29594.1 hypothetical protein ASG22_19930 [Chryseobacterium sp. Leaf405]